MSSAAQRDEMADGLGYSLEQATGTDGGLRQAVTERLAAHRERRAVALVAETQAAENAQAMASRRGTSRVRDAVAARYEQSLSYRDFLEAEAERALQQARAEAEIAQRNAVAVAEARMKLMQELEQWNHHEVSPQTVAERHADIVRHAPNVEVPHLELIHLEPQAPRIAEMVAEPVRLAVADTVAPVGLKVQLYEDVALDALHQAVAVETVADKTAAERELRELEQEIEFRLAPKQDDYVLEALPIPGNLIEFPRQLVAPRKARPRLAEGPLRDAAPVEPQLRIFEVEAEQISVAPAAEPNAAPEWQSLQLESSTAAAQWTPIHAQLQFTLQPQTASVRLRLLAASVDFVWIGAAFAGFAAVAVKLAGHSLSLLPLPLLGGCAAAVIGVLYVVYQMLFFSLAGTTPGMRYARIGLCTFGDRNPTRKAMRRRVLATIVAACPLGLGLAWACLDDERFGWHDRMSRMYQRAY